MDVHATSGAPIVVSRGFSFRLRTEQGVEVFAVKANLRAGKIFEVFGQKLRILFLASEKGAEIGVTGLGSNLARGHPQVGTDHGVEP